MAGVNKVILVGNLGVDPEVRYTNQQTPIANLRLATSESWRDKNTGERKEVTEWHRVVFFNRLAEIAQQYLRKGSQIYVEGRLQTRKWQDRDGNDRYTTEIRGDEMKMLGGMSQGGGSASQPAQSAPDQNQDFGQQPQQQAPQQPQGQAAPAMAGGGSGGFGDFTDDIPFTSSDAGVDPLIKRHSLLPQF